MNKCIQVRVKSIQFMQTEAVAIYFYDVTHNIKQLKLENKMQD